MASGMMENLSRASIGKFGDRIRCPVALLRQVILNHGAYYSISTGPCLKVIGVSTTSAIPVSRKLGKTNKANVL